MNPTTTELLTLDGVAHHLEQAARALYPSAEPVVAFEAPRRAEFGDVATNVAFTLAKAARRPPQEIAAAIVAQAFAGAPGLDATVAGAEPVAGFINLRLTPAFWQAALATLLRDGANYGRPPRSGQRISLEFGSANPTGPLVVVQGRTMSIGATLAAALDFAGDDVFTEWIINDTGSQIETLARSLYARYRQLTQPDFPFPGDGYPAGYLVPIARRIRERDGDRWERAPEPEWIPYFGTFGRDVIVAEQQATVARFGVRYDLWQSEKALHEAGLVKAGLAALAERGLTYVEDGATMVRTAQFGDDKDHVIVRSDGRPAYYAADVAYHYEKLRRADRALLILGPDHHGYVGRLAAIAAAFDRPGAIEVLIAQQITLMRGDEVVSMSKRAGDILPLDEIIDEVGVDAARFFFVMLSPEQPLTFDLALAKKQSNDNPVFYVQYGHARIASVVRRARERADGATLVARAQSGEALDRLVEPSALALIRRLSAYGPTIVGAARARAPHRLPKYARDVAADFHAFYDECRILGDDADTSVARLALALATQTVLASVLAMCGVAAPDRLDNSPAG